MSFPYGSHMDPLAQAMFEVMEKHPLRERAAKFRDGTDPDFKNAKDKEEGRKHYYEWLLDEAKKLQKEKEEKPAPSMPMPSPPREEEEDEDGVPLPVGNKFGKEQNPDHEEELQAPSDFSSDDICCCPKCNKKRRV